MFAVTTHDLTGLYSFEECHQYFNKTEQPRGAAWGDDERPLANNRKHHKRIVRCVMGGTTYSYSLMLYQTAMVTHHADGHVHVHLGHTSVSSSAYLASMTPHGLGMYATFLRVDTPKGTIYIPPAAGTVVLKRAKLAEQPHCWTVKSKLPGRTRKLVDLKKAAALRKRWGPFLEWVRIVERLNPPRIHVSFIDQRLPVDPPPQSQWLDVLDRTLRGVSKNEALRKMFWNYLYREANVYKTIRVSNTHAPYRDEDTK